MSNSRRKQKNRTAGVKQGHSMRGRRRFICLIQWRIGILASHRSFVGVCAALRTGRVITATANTIQTDLDPRFARGLEVDQASSETLPSAWPTHVRTKPCDLDSGSSPSSVVIRTCPFSNRVLQVPHWPWRHADGI